MSLMRLNYAGCRYARDSLIRKIEAIKIIRWKRSINIWYLPTHVCLIAMNRVPF